VIKQISADLKDQRSGLTSQGVRHSAISALFGTSKALWRGPISMTPHVEGLFRVP
jgi:hypothetical protein